MSRFLSLPDNDDELILRKDAHRYGAPRAQTLAKYAAYPSSAPCDLPYTMVGRHAAYSVGVLRKLREATTFRHTSDRAQKKAAKKAAI